MCQNCNQKPSIGESKPKKPKIEEVAKHSYPRLHGEPEDQTTHDRNIKLLKEEMAKMKPNSANVKNLMSHTFLHRREWILNSEIPVSKILEEYSCLYKLSICRLTLLKVCLLIVNFILHRYFMRWI